MKKFLSSAKVAAVLLALTIISLGVYTYVLTRPVSYGMSYHVKTEYMGVPYEGTMKFTSDGYLINRNSNFVDVMKSRYYYKDGYVFFLVAEDEEGCQNEIAEINANFEEATKTPFYASEVDAFKLRFSEEDDYSLVYTCNAAVIYAVVFGVIELALIVFTCLAFILSKISY